MIRVGVRFGEVRRPDREVAIDPYDDDRTMHAMALLPSPLSFLMGSDDGRDDERPVHRVDLDPFALGTCQVTNAEYASFVDATAHPPPPFWNQPAFADPLQPVVGVSWFDAVAYCTWLGPRFRLPTEAEWECAARSGIEGALYPWGNDPRHGYATRPMTAPARVGQSPPNAYGLHDMCENVHEWCSDWYDDAQTRRASRGGSWRHQIRITRCAARSSLPPHLQYADYGFRVVRGHSAIHRAENGLSTAHHGS